MEVKERAQTSRLFELDMDKIRARARTHISEGAVVSTDENFTQKVVSILNEALATELICVLRYKAHYYMAEGIHAESVKSEFLEHSRQEQEHADLIATRIKQLNGQPNFHPEGLLTRGHTVFETGNTLVELIQEDLVAERIAIEIYQEIILFLQNQDPTSRRLFEKILENEEEHAEELADLLKTLDPSKPSDGLTWLTA